jgi:hypothetical protein
VKRVKNAGWAKKRRVAKTRLKKKFFYRFNLLVADFPFLRMFHMSTNPNDRVSGSGRLTIATVSLTSATNCINVSSSICITDGFLSSFINSPFKFLINPEQTEG